MSIGAFLLEVYAILYSMRVCYVSQCPCQARSLSSVQRIAEAARRDGAGHDDVVALASGAVADTQSRRRHLLIFGLDPKVFSLEPQDILWQVVAWSLTQMAIGYYPSSNY